MKCLVNGYIKPFSRTLRWIGCGLGFTLFFSGFSSGLYAQSLSPELQEIIDRQLRVQERLEQERLEQQRRRQQPDVRLQTELTLQDEALTFDDPNCFIINRIELIGDKADAFQWALAKVLFPGDRDSGYDFDTGQAQSPLLGRCYGVKSINILMRRLQNHLIQRGYVTTRVLAGPQALTTGVLQLTIIPGIIGDIRFQGESHPNPLALPFRRGQLLNLRSIEQALENLKRVPSVNTDIRIAPASGPDAQPGYSDLIILWQQDRPWRIGLSADDAGSEATGLYQANLSLSYDNPLGLSDLLTLSYGSAVADANTDQGGSDYIGFYYSLPIGYWQLSLLASEYEYQQSIDNLIGQAIYSGRSQNASLDLSRLLYRDQFTKLNAGIGVWWRRSNNFIEDVELQNQRRRTGGFDTSLSYRAFIGSSTLTGTLTYRKGTGLGGAEPAPEDVSGIGTARAGIWQTYISTTTPFTLGSQPVIYRSQWRHQHNRDALTTQDYFTIGSRHTVRGYHGADTLADNRGWWVRNDLELPTDNPGQRAYFGLDYGRVSGGNNQHQRDWLSGGAFGVKGRFYGIHYDLFASWPIRQPRHFDGDIYLTQMNVYWQW